MVNITQDKCVACTKTVYLTEKIVVEDKEDRKTFHKLCLKCSHCKLTLSLGNYASMNGVFFCKPHFKQLFATKGNYDEGFGKTKHTEKWTPQATPTGSGSFIKVEETAVGKAASEKKETPSAITNKFSSSAQDKCVACSKTVYLTEKLVVEDKEDRKVLHKQCLKCSHCSVTLNLGTYASMGGVFYCKPHFKQLFATKGNYDESFGATKATDKWAPTTNSAPTSFVPLEKTNVGAEKNTNQSANPDIAKKFSTGGAEKCQGCQKTVYLTEKVVLEELDTKRIFHKACLKCTKCSVILTLGTLVQLDGVIFCKPHFKELYATQGNLDGGFGKPKHSEKWENNPFPYLEKDESYVPSVEKVDSQIQSNTSNESEVDRFKNIHNNEAPQSRREKAAEQLYQQQQQEKEQAQQEEEKVEEPVVVAPVVEEEKVEEPAQEESTPVVEEEKVEEPAAPVEQEEEKVEEPVQEESSPVEEEKVEEPAQEESSPVEEEPIQEPVQEPIAVEDN